MLLVAGKYHGGIDERYMRCILYVNLELPSGEVLFGAITKLIPWYEYI